MKLDECLPTLHAPNFIHGGREWYAEETLHTYGLACARAGALAALDEAMKQVADGWNDSETRVNQRQQALRSADVIRRLRDTIMEGK